MICLASGELIEDLHTTLQVLHSQGGFDVDIRRFGCCSASSG
jgi:hypothetical protein